MTETHCNFSNSQRSFKLHNVIKQCKRSLAVQLQEVPSVVYGMFKHIHVIQQMKLVLNLRDMKQQMYKLHKKKLGTCSTNKRDEKYIITFSFKT